MTKTGEKLLEGAREMLAIAKGEQPAASITMNGHTYVPKEKRRRVDVLDSALREIRRKVHAHNRGGGLSLSLRAEIRDIADAALRMGERK